MIANILSDPTAKLFTYGRNTPLILDRPAASKTGTTDNYRDTWTNGYTTNLAIVVWVGNTDGHPMSQALSTMTAGKIWPQAMQASFTVLGLDPSDFPRPSGLVEQQVCGDTALRPGEPPCRNDLYIQGQAPQITPTPAATEVPTPARESTQPPEATQLPEPTAAPAPAEQPTPPPQPTVPPAPVVQPPPPPAPTVRPTPPPAPTAKPQPTSPPAKPTAPPKPAATPKLGG